MATTFTRQECDQILSPALKVALPAIGLNRHFPRDMLFGLNDHHGLGLPHLYDTQGFWHLQALMKFGASSDSTGNLLLHSYEALQLELGLPGEVFEYPYEVWKQLVTPTWMTQTWKYACEKGFCIRTGAPALRLRCQGDQFLNLMFWQHGCRGERLATLNRCRLYLQLTTLAELVDGKGEALLRAVLSGIRPSQFPALYQWPMQGQLPFSAWQLWRETIQAMCSLRSHYQLSSHLGKWYDLEEEWNWFWIAIDERLLLRVNMTWQVWLPSRRTRFYGSTFVPTTMFLQQKPSNAQRAIISTNSSQVTFWGARGMVESKTPP